LEPDAHGLIWLPDEAFPTAFAQDATAEEQAVLNAVQRPISPATLSITCRLSPRRLASPTFSSKW